MLADVPIPTAEHLGIPVDFPFGEAFDKHLLELVKRRLEVLKTAPADRIARAAALFGETPHEVAEAEILKWFRGAVKFVPDAHLSAFLEELMKRGNDFTREMGGGRHLIQSARRHIVADVVRESGKAKESLNKLNSLTSQSASGKVAPVMSKPITSWPELRERLIALTGERGAKAALARQFNVTPSAVSEWTRGVSMPSADATLRLLPWVTAEEAKQKPKSSQDASTSGEPKTQPKDTNESKLKSGRKKK